MVDGWLIHRRARCSLAIGLSLLAVTTACNVQIAGEPATGSLALALQSSGQDGALYRLREATLRISGQSEQTVHADENEAVLHATLPVGAYSLTLEPGWQLEQQQGGEWQPVEATLASDNPQAFAIEAGATTQLGLRFVVRGAPPVELANGMLDVGLEVAQDSGADGGCIPHVVINEIDPDQEGSDTLELVELLNAGDCAVATERLMLVLRNGGAADAPSYAEIGLTTAGAELPAGGYLVVGGPMLIASVPESVLRVSDERFTLQNGPDGAELQLDGQVIDALSYGGAIAGVTEGTTATADRGAGALARCPDGRDSNDNGRDFAAGATPTPGGANSCP